MAKRLDVALSEIVGDHQAYGIKGRRISDNLHTMRVLCETTSLYGDKAAVLKVDLSKAFDRIDTISYLSCSKLATSESGVSTTSPSSIGGC